MPNCYYYDEQHNHCKCYINENLNELLAENAKLRELVRGLIYATHPADRARLIADAAELGVEVGDG